MSSPFKWVIDELDGTDMNSHENVLWPVAEELLPDGGVFIDVGANMGMWSVMLGRRASKVKAIEPNPAAAEVLRENVLLNQLASVIEVIELAAWDDAVSLELVNPPGHDDPRAGMMRVVPSAYGSVRGARLDDVLGDLDRIDLVKMDVEGSDLHSLRGMSGLLTRHRPALIVESHHVYGYFYLEELLDLLKNLEYEHKSMDWRGQFHLICHPAEKQPA
jgi:FkbM family methyltransferase